MTPNPRQSSPTSGPHPLPPRGAPRPRALLAPALLAVVCLILGACGGDAAGRDGAELFRDNCTLCHGSGARGKSGVAASLIGNPTFRELSDRELVELIVQGIPSSHPRNDTGVPMPPKGGHPELTEEQIGAIVGHLRGLQP